MEDLDYDVLNKIVESKNPGFKLLQLSLPGLKPKFEPKKFSYFPIFEDGQMMVVWITNQRDAFEIEISKQEYLDEIAKSI